MHINDYLVGEFGECLCAQIPKICPFLMWDSQNGLSYETE